MKIEPCKFTRPRVLGVLSALPVPLQLHWLGSDPFRLLGQFSVLCYRFRHVLRCGTADAEIKGVSSSAENLEYIKALSPSLSVSPSLTLFLSVSVCLSLSLARTDRKNRLWPKISIIE